MNHTRRPIVLGVFTALFFVSCISGPAEKPDTTETGGPRRSDTVGESLVETRLAAMSVDQRIAQRMIIFVPRGFSLDNRVSRNAFTDELDRLQPGGIILYPWNYESSAEVKAMTRLFQLRADNVTPGMRFLVCADQEGGRVAAFRFDDIVRLPSAYNVGAHADPEFVRAAAYVNGVELRELGVNMNLAPVLDLTDTPDRGIIGDRSMGPDAERVARLGAAYIEALSRTGVIATAKHFPGHGVTTIDSHGRLPTVEYDLETLRKHDLAPFAAAIDAGVPAIMTAHILFPRIDPDYPVTLSEVFLHDVLRNELGFDGVVISDGLEMGALAANYDLDTTLERAIRFGIDLILLYARYDLDEIVTRTHALLDAGRITEEEIDAGVRRILNLKYEYGLLNGVP